MVKENKIQVQKTAHYFTIGTPGPHIKKLWIVCHGYGQLASSIIHKFEKLDDGETLIVAPEALSRFYWGGFSGDVGASWMTKAHRLDEIEDYTNYLQQIYERFSSQISPSARINLFGFSQGCVTQVRWIVKHYPAFSNLILWGGIVADDLEYASHLAYLSDKNIYFVYGDKDQFLTKERIAKYTQFMNDQQLDIATYPFEGKHEVVRSVLHQLIEEKDL